MEGICNKIAFSIFLLLSCVAFIFGALAYCVKAMYQYALKRLCFERADKRANKR